MFRFWNSRAMCTLSHWITIFLFVLPSLLAAEHEDLPMVKIVHRVLDNCMNREQVSECLKVEATNALDTVLKSTNSITLFPGVQLQRRPEEITELTNSIASTGRTQMSSFDRFWDSWQKFLSSWSVNIQLADNQDVEEGRGKKKKIFRYIAVAAATAAAILIPIKLKIIALVAATALGIGKIALVLVSLVGLKTLVSKPHEETTHVHYDAHRSDQGHYLAYSGYDLPPGNSVDYYQ